MPEHPTNPQEETYQEFGPDNAEAGAQANRDLGSPTPAGWGHAGSARHQPAPRLQRGPPAGRLPHGRPRPEGDAHWRGQSAGGCGFAFIHSTLHTWATDVCPEARGTTTAFFSGGCSQARPWPQPP